MDKKVLGLNFDAGNKKNYKEKAIKKNNVLTSKAKSHVLKVCFLVMWKTILRKKQLQNFIRNLALVETHLFVQ